MSTKKTAAGILLATLLILLFTSLFTVYQGTHGIILRLGRLVNDTKTGQVKIFSPGLHMKTPFIETVRVFDTRIQTLDIKSSRIVTREKKDVMVDYYAKWRVENMAQYFKSTGGNSLKAETLLEQQLNTLLRAEFGKRTIPELVSGERGDVMVALLQSAEKQASELGIHVVDVRIKGIELPANTSNAIYQRMRADMQKIANRHRADGHAEAEFVQAQADANVTVLLATARSDGQKARALGKAKAAGIYAKAYGQNKPFFSFYRSLIAYQDSFNSKQDIFVLDQSSAFFDYFKGNAVTNSSVPVKK
jgi:membrane protease subunit HflC